MEEFRGRIYSDNATEKFRGAWREKFLDHSPSKQSSKATRRPLHVEIGCNGGHVSLEWANRSPDDAFIGLDWKFKQIHRGAEKAQKRKLDNLIFFRSHAERLPFMFGEGEIDFLYLFFPDPWPKKAQWKNRYLTADRLLAIAPLVRPGGVFHIKTDHAGYFEWMEAAVHELQKENGRIWEVTDLNRDLHQNHPNPTSLQIPDVTLFERLFIKDGIKINQMKLTRL